MEAKTFATKLGEWIRWLLPILLFFIPVLWAGYYQAADLLGSRQLPNSDGLTKWILGLLTLWLTSQGLESLFSDRPGQRVEDQMHKHFNEMGVAVDNLKQLLLERLNPQKVVFDETRDYEKPIELIEKASPMSWIYLTDLASGGETDPVVSRYAKTRDDRILRDDCNFRKIVAVYSKEGLNELKRHLKRCSLSKNYELRVFKGRCLVEKADIDLEPRFDVIILAPSKAVFGLTRSGGFIAQYSGALQVNDKEITGIFLSWFDSLWVISKPLKTKKGVDEVFLQELERQLLKPEMTEGE